MHGYRVCLTVAMLLAVGVAGCAPPSTRVDASGGSQPAKVAPKRLVAALVGDVTALSSAINAAGSGGAHGVNETEMLLTAGLTHPATDQGPLNAQLAEAVPSIENGLWKVLPDGRMETIWQISPRARWQDGTPVTADDMVFTAQVGTERSLAMRQNAGFAFVESVEALDSRTVLTRWKTPFIEADWMFTYVFALPLPRHILGRAFEESRESFTDLPYWTSEFVGAGPFRLREFVRGERLVLEANDDYVLGRPKVDIVEIRFLASETAFLAQLLAGEVELTIGSGLEPEALAQLRERWPGGRTLVGPTTSSDMIFPQYVDPRPAIITNVEFRRALLHAVDRQAIIDVIFHGLATVAEVSVVNPAQPEYSRVERWITRYEFDARKATQMIEQLGYARGTTGAFMDSSGQPLTLEVRGTDGANEQLALTVAGYWQRIGINALPVVIPRPRASDREYRNTRPAFEISNASSELKGLESLHSRQLAVPDNNWAGTNRARYANPQLDVLLNRYFATIPSGERIEILGQITRHLSEQLVTLGIHYGIDSTAAANRLQNVRPGEPRNSIEWDLVD